MRLFGRFSNTVCTLEPPKLVGGGDWAYISHTWDLSTVSVFLIVINQSLLVNQIFFPILRFFSDFPIFFNLTIFSIWHFLNKKIVNFCFQFHRFVLLRNHNFDGISRKKLQFSRQKNRNFSRKKHHFFNFFFAFVENEELTCFLSSDNNSSFFGYHSHHEWLTKWKTRSLCQTKEFVLEKKIFWENQFIQNHNFFVDLYFKLCTENLKLNWKKNWIFRHKNQFLLIWIFTPKNCQYFFLFWNYNFWRENSNYQGKVGI